MSPTRLGPPAAAPASRPATGPTPSSIGAAELSRLLGLPTPTDEQAEVIESGLVPSVVIAGAGSGKTETMAARVVWLVANRHLAPDAVLGLTFTRKAAAELGVRIRRRLAQWRHVVERESPDDVEHLALLRAAEPTVSTYAAYAGRLVSEQALRLGVEPDARLMSPAVSWQLADRVMRNHPGELPPDIGAPSSLVKYVLFMAAQLADHLVEAEAVDAFCADIAAQVAALPGKLTKTGDVATFLRSTAHRRALLPLVAEFAAAKAALPAVDFGDQMRLAARLAGLDEVRAVERARYGAVLLDEYQDTGHAQIAMLHGLFGAGHPVTAVGDPFQSIYGWRGASAGNIEGFATTFQRRDGSPAAVYPLATSFRNDRRVLSAANAVAAPLRTGVSLGQLRPGPRAAEGTLEIAFTETHVDEARWVAARLASAWAAQPPGARTAAVLVRRRAQIPVLADALREAGLPVEVVGLGGLLTTPEVSDVVATLRVLAGFSSGTALARLLVGARWRIGPRDLAALRDRARWLVRGDAVGGTGPSTGPDATAAVPDDEQLSLVEALDDLGPPDRYSPEGYRRMSALSGELRRLRRRVSGSLPELVAEVERVSGVEIEVLARPDRATVGRVHLDRFLDEAAQFVSEAGDASSATLSAFLAFLDAAEDEENGLEAGEVEVAAERVQILTVHGAKGLEWDIVAVPGLVDKIFPAEPRGTNWTRARHELPGPLRGDRDELPALVAAGAGDLAELGKRLKRHHDDLVARHADEERRLAYVALTRAKHVLLASGFTWDAAVKPREVSPYLVALREFAEPDAWFVPAADALNPVNAEVRTGLWPFDPLGPPTAVGGSAVGGSAVGGAAVDGPAAGRGRRGAVERGAALVRAAMAAPADTAGADDADDGRLPDLALPARAGQWRHDVQVLLEEQARLSGADAFRVELPRQLSVSQLVELQRDPAELARSIRRPVPRPPAPLARRGTAFHTWLEQRWQAQTLLDVDELPGAADDGADDADFAQLRAAFERSEWATRTPAEIEVPFEMTIAGNIVRGRMDAVFGSTADGWLVVDWKTGRRPTGAAAHSAAVQLAVYRLAWARLSGIADDELHQVRAAFHYVRSNDTVQPADLLDADGLRELVAGA